MNFHNFFFIILTYWGVTDIKYETKLDALETVKKQFGEDGKELVAGRFHKRDAPI